MNINGKAIMEGLAALAVVIPLVVKAVKAFGKWMCSLSSNAKNYFGSDSASAKGIKPSGIPVSKRNVKKEKEEVRSRTPGVDFSDTSDVKLQRVRDETQDVLQMMVDKKK